MGPGEYFGELALVSEGAPRAFSGRVTGDQEARFFTVNQDGFKQIFRHNPQALAEIEMKIMRWEPFCLNSKLFLGVSEIRVRV